MSLQLLAGYGLQGRRGVSKELIAAAPLRMSASMQTSFWTYVTDPMADETHVAVISQPKKPGISCLKRAGE